MGLGGATVVVFGLAAIAGIAAPILLALVLTICAHPVRRGMERHGVPRGLATGSVVITVFVVLAAFVFVLGLALGQFAALLPQFASRSATSARTRPPGSRASVSVPRRCRRWRRASTRVTYSRSRPNFSAASRTSPWPS
ncbi:AI-2E family transporter [Cryobacterium sp.]|uniref:AI-2E family transporter n=1 Tax=Cryobacterium sp. TaxID=1926290 RepID=UPI00345E042D